MIADSISPGLSFIPQAWHADKALTRTCCTHTSRVLILSSQLRTAFPEHPPHTFQFQAPPASAFEVPDDTPIMPRLAQPTTSITPAAAAWLNTVVAQASKAAAAVIAQVHAQSCSTQGGREGGGGAADGDSRRQASSSEPLPSAAATLIYVEEQERAAGAAGQSKDQHFIKAAPDQLQAQALGQGHAQGWGGVVSHSQGGSTWDQDLEAWGHRPGAPPAATNSLGIVFAQVRVCGIPQRPNPRSVF